MGISDDGRRSFFQTTESLVASDTDTVQDVYQRVGGATTLLSVGPTAGQRQLTAPSYDATADGSQVFFSTAESLVASDTDAGSDVYERSDGSHHDPLDRARRRQQRRGRAASRGSPQTAPTCSSRATEQLIAAPVDRDSQIDVYERRAVRSRWSRREATTPSPPPPTSPAHPPTARGCSSAPRKHLRSGDTDKYQDIYEFRGGRLTRLSTGPAGGNGPTHAFFGGSLAGRHPRLLRDVRGAGGGRHRRAAPTCTSATAAPRAHQRRRRPAGTAPTTPSSAPCPPTASASSSARPSHSLAADTDLAPDVYSANVPGTVTVQPQLDPERCAGLQLQRLRARRRLQLRAARLRADVLRPGRRPGPDARQPEVFTGVRRASATRCRRPVPGWTRPRPRCDDGSPPANIDVDAGRGRHLHVHRTRSAARSWSSRTRCPTTPQDFSFTAGGGLSPDELLARRRLRRDAVQHAAPSPTSRRAAATRVSESVPAGWDQASATCNDGSPVSNINVAPGRDGDLHVHQPQARPDRRRQGRAAQRRRRTSRFTAGGGLPDAASSSTTTRTATLSNTRTFTNVAPGSGYSVSETVPSGWDQSSATCDDGSPVSNINVAPARPSPARSRTASAGRSSSSRTRCPNDPQDFGFTAGGGLARRASRSTTTPTPTLRTPDTFTNVAARTGYSSRRPCPPAGSQRAPPAATAARCRTSTCGPGETVTCTFVEPEARAAHDRQGRAARTTRRTSRSPPAAASRRAASSSTTTRTARCRTPAPSANVGAGTVLACRRRAQRLGPGQRHLQRRQPGVQHQRRRRRERHLHVHEPEARPDRGRSRTHSPNDAQDFAFTAGGGPRPTSFQLDDDADADALQHAHVQRRAAGAAATRSPRPCPAGWDQASATCDDGSPVSNINVGAGRGRHLHVHEPEARADRDREGRALRTTRRTSASRPAAASARPASSSTTTPTGRSRTPARSPTSRPARVLGLRDGAERLGPDQRHLRRRQPGLEHRRRRRRDRHLHVHEPQARRRSWS